MIDDGYYAGLIENKVLAFEEVSRFADASLTENIQAVFTKEHHNPGIKLSMDDDEITIGVEIIVYFGANIPRLCYDIQSKLKTYLEEMTGIPIRAINIEIVGIDKNNNGVEQ